MVSASDCVAAGAAAGEFGIGIVLALMIAGMLIGYVWGTRGKQILAAMRKAFKMFLDSRFVASLTVKVSKDDKDGEDDENGRVDEEIPDSGPGIEDFLSTQPLPQLEDHQDVEVNPIILYQVKLAKEKAREDRQTKIISELRDKMIAEGLSEDEIVEKLLESTNVAAQGSSKQNALATLISIGASFTPGAGQGNQEQVALQDRRRRMRNVESYLANALDIDVRKPKTEPKKNASGVAYKDAYQVARETKVIPFDGGRDDRSKSAIRFAKDSRKIFKDYHKAHPYTTEVVNDEESDEEEKKSFKDKRRKALHGSAAKKADAEGLAALQAEFDGLDMDDIHDMDHEDGEGYEDDEAEHDLLEANPNLASLVDLPPSRNLPPAKGPDMNVAAQKV